MEETDLLVELVRRRRDCLAEMAGLGRRQLEVIRRDDLTQLMNVLAAKQRLLSELQAVERDLHPFRGQAPESRHWRSPADREGCADRLAECDAIYATILEQEKQGEQALRERRDEVAERLQVVHAAGRALCGYETPSVREGGALDLVSES